MLIWVSETHIDIFEVIRRKQRTRSHFPALRIPSAFNPRTASPFPVSQAATVSCWLPCRQVHWSVVTSTGTASCCRHLDHHHPALAPHLRTRAISSSWSACLPARDAHAIAVATVDARPPVSHQYPLLSQLPTPPLSPPPSLPIPVYISSSALPPPSPCPLPLPPTLSPTYAKISRNWLSPDAPAPLLPASPDESTYVDELTAPSICDKGRHPFVPLAPSHPPSARLLVLCPPFPRLSVSVYRPALVCAMHAAHHRRSQEKQSAPCWPRGHPLPTTYQPGAVVRRRATPSPDLPEDAPDAPLVLPPLEVREALPRHAQLPPALGSMLGGPANTREGMW